MKYIQYIMTDRKGEVKTFRVRCQQNESDDVNLELFRPEQLRGNAAVRLRSYLKEEFSLSNWHVVEIEDCPHPIPERGPAQCKAGHWGGSPQHPVL